MRFLLPLILLFAALSGECARAGTFRPEQGFSSSFDLGFSDFTLQDRHIKGKFRIKLFSLGESVILKVSGRDVDFGGLGFSRVEAKIINKQGKMLISYIRADDIFAEGEVDMNQRTVDLEFNALNAEVCLDKLRTKIKGAASLKGAFSGPMVKGTLVAGSGVYSGKSFKEARINFSGFYPDLRLNNSSIMLADGSSYTMSGFLDLRSLTNNSRASLTLVSRDIYLGGNWRFYSERGETGLVREIDPKMEMALRSSFDDDSGLMGEYGAQFKYELNSDYFFKVKVGQDKSILGFEKRREF